MVVEVGSTNGGCESSSVKLRIVLSLEGLLTPTRSRSMQQYRTVEVRLPEEGGQSFCFEVVPSTVGLGSSIGIGSLILGVSLTHPLGFWVLGNDLIQTQVGDVVPVSTRIQGHWGRFLVQVNGLSDALLRLANDVNVNIGGRSSSVGGLGISQWVLWGQCCGETLQSIKEVGGHNEEFVVAECVNVVTDQRSWGMRGGGANAVVDQGG